jgi:hypothetical protein
MGDKVHLYASGEMRQLSRCPRQPRQAGIVLRIVLDVLRQCGLAIGRVNVRVHAIEHVCQGIPGGARSQELAGTRDVCRGDFFARSVL